MHTAPKVPDEALVSAAKAGDRDAFGLLVERYRDLVFAIAYSRVGSVDAAQDIAQDAFLASFEGLPSLRSPSKYRAWLARITRKLCGTWHRSENYRRAVLSRLRELARLERAPTPDHILEAKETQKTLRAAIDHLPTSNREALILYYLRGRSAAESAGILGISEQALWKRLERARRRIRDYIAEEVGESLRSARPSEDFTKRTLAAIPAGSICAKLGLNVTKLTLAEAVRELAQATLQHASTILTGGMTVTITKGTLTAAAVVLLAVAGTGYLVVRYGRGSADGPGSVTAVAESAEESRTDMSVKAEALSEADTPPSPSSEGAAAKLDAEWLIQQVDQWKPGWTEGISRTFLEDPANAFNRFLFAAALMKDSSQFQEAKDLLRSSDFSWLSEPDKLALIQAYLDANAEALAALKAAIEQAEYYQGPPFFYKGDNPVFTYLYPFEALAFMLRGEALLLLSQGNAERGLSDSLAVLTMAHHVIGGGILVESMVGAFVRHVGGTAFEFLLSEVRTPTLCRQAIAQLDQLLSLDAYRVRGQVLMDANSAELFDARWLTSSQQDTRETVDILNAGLDLPYCEFASLSRPAHISPLAGWDAIKPSASTLYREKASMVAYMALAAIKAYQLELGHFPETLEQLVPEYLPEIPIDPFIGEPFKYVRSEDAVVVYSVGLDLKDDGGKKWTGSTLKGKGDYVFQVR